MGVLHGEQYLEIRRPLPAAATVVTTPRLVSIQDKGRAAVLVIAAETRVQGSAQVSTYQEITVFARGAGGFGGEGGGVARPPGATAPAYPPPGVAPSATATADVPPAATLLYRLSGDTNPLHADPEFAALAGFPRPILHGLATLGYAVRAVMDAYAGGEAEGVRTIKVREEEGGRKTKGQKTTTLIYIRSRTPSFFPCPSLPGPHGLARLPGRHPGDAHVGRSRPLGRAAGLAAGRVSDGRPDAGGGGRAAGD